MRKLLALSYLLLAVSYYLPAQAQPSRARQAASATCVIDFLKSYANARETTGYNRGPQVDKLILAGGGNPYQRKSPEYCGFSQAAAARACGLPMPARGMQGAARCWFTDEKEQHVLSRTIYHRKLGYGSVDSIRVGLKAGYDYGNGIRHINCVAALGRPVRAGRAPRSYWAWGGNEGTGTEAGVHYNVWPIGACDALSNWNY